MEAARVLRVDEGRIRRNRSLEEEQVAAVCVARVVLYLRDDGGG